MQSDKYSSYLESIQSALEEVAKEMADIEVKKSDEEVKLSNETVSVIIGIVGENKGRILIEMNRSTAKQLAESINGEPFSNIMELYLTLMEFSNIFCGNAVTLINNNYKGSDLRLTPPAVFAGIDVDIMSPNIGSTNIFCICDYGPVLLDIGFEEV